MRPPIINIAGTTWSGNGVVAPTVYTFEKDGSLTYSYNGNTYNRGSWTQKGKEIYWEMNDKYCEFKGTITKETITGNSWNVRGGSWDITVKKGK